MLNAYFDNQGHGNLYRLTNLRSLTFDFVDEKNLTNSNFKIKITKDDYTFPGIYIVSVKEYSPQWSGKDLSINSRHVLFEIPLNVINAARHKNVFIVIDNSSEGFPLNYQECDGFRELHTAMNQLKLPPLSVILVTSDRECDISYNEWLITNNENRMISHVYAFTHVHYFVEKIPDQPLIISALNNPEVKNFNSLNRTARNHRVEHIIELYLRELEKNALISGHYRNDSYREILKNFYVDMPYSIFCNSVKSVFSSPLIIDGDWSSNTDLTPDKNNETIFNHSIYKNSLLSVVTETLFHSAGNFITEKTMKPIAAGHPFMILGQFGFLKNLNEMGYKTRFYGIDQSYDDIKDPIKRFQVFHQSLEKWCKYSYEEKKNFIEKSLPYIEYNQNLFRSKNYIKDYYDCLYKTVLLILKKNKYHG